MRRLKVKAEEPSLHGARMWCCYKLHSVTESHDGFRDTDFSFENGRLG
jgi:hypothetical protein